MCFMKAFRKIFVFNWPAAPVALHAMLKFCGRERVAGDYKWNGLRRGDKEFVLWQHTVSGEGALVYEGRRHELRAGDSMLVHIPHDHEYFIPEGSGHWEFYFVGLNGREAVRVAREVERKNGPVFRFDTESSEQVRLLRDVIRAASEKKIDSALKASSLAYRMVCGLAEGAVGGDSSEKGGPESIRRTVELCLNSPGRLNSVEELARTARMSRAHFSREFKRVTGLAPYEFVTDHALRRAANLLQTGSFSVKEVASMSGFSGVSVFCRAFKKAYGFSPGSFLR